MPIPKSFKTKVSRQAFTRDYYRLMLRLRRRRRALLNVKRLAAAGNLTAANCLPFSTTIRRTSDKLSPSMRGWAVMFLALVVFSLLMAVASILKPSSATAATANTVNFQARLESIGGAIAADGTYNVEFNLYNVSSGGTSLWTEDRLVSAGQGVTVKNGYLTANLGAVNPLPANIWNQQLWLGMTVRGTGSCAWASCTPADTEMSPRLSMTAVPAAYALTNTNGSFSSSLTIAGPTGGNQSFILQDQGASGTFNICIQNSAACGFAPVSGTLSGSYINNTTSVQTGASFFIQAASGNVGGVIKANGSGDLLDLQNSSGSLLSRFNNNGDLAIGGANSAASATAFMVQNTDGGALLTADTSGSRIVIGNTSSSADAVLQFANSGIESAGPGSPSAAADDTTVGTSIWSNPTNVFANDASYATNTVNANAASDYLDATGFGFNVPSDATIVGVKAEVERKADSASLLRDNSVKILKSGTVTGSDRADTGTFWPTTEAYASYGSASDMWGATLTPADVNASNFGVATSVFNTHASFQRVASLDHVRVTVYYTEPSDGGTWTTGSSVSSGEYRIAVGSDLSNPVLSLSTSGNAYFSGNVGIGTTSPGSPLEIANSGADYKFTPNNVTLQSATGTTMNLTLSRGSCQGIVRFGSAGGDLTIGSNSGCSSTATTFTLQNNGNIISTGSLQIGAIAGYTSGAAAPLRIDAQGSLGVIRATSTGVHILGNTNANYPLDVQGDINTDSAYRFTNSTFNLSLNTATLSANRAYTFPYSTAVTDTICLQTLANCGGGGTTYDGTDFIVNGTAAQTANFNIQGAANASPVAKIDVGSSTGNLLQVGDGSLYGFVVNNAGFNNFYGDATFNGFASFVQGAYIDTGIDTATDSALNLGNAGGSATSINLNLNTTIASGKTLTVNGSSTFNIGNTSNLSVVSDLSGGARSTYPLVISQANNATNNNSVGLLQLSNLDTASAAAVLNITQADTAGTGISFTSLTGGTSITVANTSGTALNANTLTTGTGLTATALTTGAAVVAGIPNGATTASALRVTNAATGITADYSGSIINVSPTMTLTAAATRNISGNFLNLNRSYTVNNATGVINMSGTLANLQSNCARTTGTCNDTASLLKLNQLDASATGTIAVVQNSGSGDFLQLQDNTGAWIDRFTSNGNLVLGNNSTAAQLYFGDGSSSNQVSIGTAVQANAVALTIPADTNTTDTICLQTLANCGGGGGSGVATIGALDGGTYSANGASISGTTMYLQAATGTHVGLVTTGAQTFGGAKTFSGAATFNDDATFNLGLYVASGGEAVNIQGAPINTSLGSLINIGNNITGGNNATNGGTYLGINLPGTGAGSAADFFNFEKNGVSKLKLDNSGNLLLGGSINSDSLTSSGLTFGAASAATVQSANNQNLILQSQGTGTVAINSNFDISLNSQEVDLEGSTVNIDGSFLSVTSGSSIFSANGNALSVTGTPAASGISSLIQLGGPISGGNANGTYIGLNAPSTGAGSAADLLNLQVGGTSLWQLQNNGLFSMKDASGNNLLDTNFGVQLGNWTTPTTIDGDSSTGVYLRSLSGTSSIDARANLNSAGFVVQNASGYNELNVDLSTNKVTLGNISTTAGHAIQGKLVFGDGTVDGFGLTLQSSTITANRTYSFPNSTAATDTICLQTLANCSGGGGVTTIGAIDGGTYSANGASISGSTMYLQAATGTHVGLVTTGTQTFAGDKTLTGFTTLYGGEVIGQLGVDTALLTPAVATDILDSNVSSTLNIGQTSGGVATAINLNQNVTVAAGKSIDFVGGITSTRPASPTKGQLYFDTSTNQLIQYNGSKWVSDARTATKIVAASNSSQAAKDAADYVATGTNDATTINSALSALPAGGGTVYLEEGTYTLGTTSIAVPNNTILSGAGRATLLTYPSSSIGVGTYSAITNSAVSGSHITVQNLMINGNSSAQSGTFYGVYFNGASNSQINNVEADAMNNGDGIYLYSAFENTLSGNTADSNDVSGIHIDHFSVGNTLTGNTTNYNGYDGIYARIAYNNSTDDGNAITGNTADGNSNSGIELNSSQYNTATGNSVSGNSYGIKIMGNDTVTGNSALGNSTDIDVYGSSNTITGNTVSGKSGASFYGIYLEVNSSNNTISANNISGAYSRGIDLNQSSNNTVSGNQIYDNGDTTDNNGIYLESASTKNTINGNNITDSSCTTTCYAINISDTASTGNYLAGNHFVGDGTHNATIHDVVTGGNTYSGQQLTQNGDASFRNATNSATAFQIQNAAGTALFTADTSSSQLVVSGATTINSTLSVIANTSSAAIFTNQQNTTTTAGQSTYALQAQFGGTDALLLRQNQGVGGYTDLRILGNGTAVPILSLIAPNGTNYASLTFDGSNTELETDTGDINIRDYNTTGSVNLWSTNHNQKLRIGNQGFSQALDLVHDGTNATISTTTGSIQLQPASSVVVKAASDSTAVFQVQKTLNGNSVFNVNTTDGRVVLGTAGSIGGQLLLAGSTSGYVALTTAPAAGTYTLILPTSAGNANDCLKNSGTAGTLTFGSCGGGGGGNTRKIQLNAEYPQSTLDAASDGTCSTAYSGTMTSGFTGTATLRNFYKWTTTNTTAQCYDVVVRVPIPSDFSSWSGAPTIDTYVSSTSNAAINIETRDTGGTVDANNYASITPASANTWTTQTLSSLAGTYTPGSTMTIRIRLSATDVGGANDYAEIGTINLNYVTSF